METNFLNAESTERECLKSAVIGGFCFSSTQPAIQEKKTHTAKEGKGGGGGRTLGILGACQRVRVQIKACHMSSES